MLYFCIVTIGGASCTCCRYVNCLLAFRDENCPILRSLEVIRQVVRSHWFLSGQSVPFLVKVVCSLVKLKETFSPDFVRDRLMIYGNYRCEAVSNCPTTTHPPAIASLSMYTYVSIISI
jgi:hypothetical protein